MTSCINSDPTAPEGSTITVSADPQTVAAGGASTITATVRSSNGTRLPDQEVLFSTSQGTLNPPAQSSLITDKKGQVSSILASASNATVTAQSGGISSTTSVNVVNCNLSTIIIAFEDTSQNPILACSDRVDLVATALDTAGAGCPGVIINFGSQSVLGVTELIGDFSSPSVVTDGVGEARSQFLPELFNCQNSCQSPNPDDCEVEVFADDFTGNFFSNDLKIREAIN